MTISRDERETLIDEAQSNPESVTEGQVDKISMGIYQDEDLQKKAIDSLIEISRTAPDTVTETAAKSLMDGFTGDDAIVRRRAGVTITNFCRTAPDLFEEATPTVIDVLCNDGSRSVQRQAAEVVEAISQQRPQFLTGELSELRSVVEDDSLHDDDIAKREAIVTALGNVGSGTRDQLPVVLDGLAEAMDDPWKDVREASLNALGAIGTERPAEIDDCFSEAVTVVTNSEEAPAVRIAAVDAIEAIGRERPELLAECRLELRDVLPDEEPERADAVERATVAYRDGETQVHARIMSFLEHSESFGKSSL